MPALRPYADYHSAADDARHPAAADDEDDPAALLPRLKQNGRFCAARSIFIGLHKFAHCHADAMRIFSFCMADLPSVDLLRCLLGFWRARRDFEKTPGDSPDFVVCRPASGDDWSWPDCLRRPATDYSGQTAVPCGAFSSGFTGPSPPPTCSGGPLETCSIEPMSGFYPNGCDRYALGIHP